jgi:nitrite reductase/ring-hydroxylating ferredoxin subunit
MTLELAIKEAIYEEAPDVTAIEVAGADGRTEVPSSALLPVIQLPDANGHGHTRGGWKEIGGVRSIPEGSTCTQEVSGRVILVCRVAGLSYAYENACPSCGLTLDDARLNGTTLVCAGCGRSYDIPRAGRGVDDPSRHLEPFPLLVEDDRMKVAVPY